MYLFENGLGEPFKPRPKAPAKPAAKAPAQPPVKPRWNEWVMKGGHRRFCPAPSDRTMGCDLELRVRFRRSFDEFLHEVEGAYGRWMERSTARRLIKTLQESLKKLHQEMLYNKVLDNDPLILSAGLFYRRSNGSWLAEGSGLRQWRRLIDL